MRWLKKDQNDSNLILFHHRNPTSTINVRKAAHPFTTGDYFGDNEYILIHNGWLTNAYDLADSHEDLDIEYQSLLQDSTFNDSEALLWDFALTMEGRQSGLYSEGAMAIICVKLVKGRLDKLYFGRNSNPLYMLRDKDGLQLSSEGEGEMITPEVLHTYNYKLKRLTKRAFEFPEYKRSFYSEKTYEYSGSGKWVEGDDGVWRQAPLVTTIPTPSVSDILDDWYPPTGVRRIQDVNEPTLPAKAEVETMCLAYLATAKGRFSDAYWRLDADYIILEAKAARSQADYDQMRLMKAAMRYLDDDPEFEDESSVSSIWEALWVQTALV